MGNSAEEDGRGREEERNQIQQAGIGRKQLMEGGNNRREVDMETKQS